MTTQINSKSLSLSILIALAGLVGCGPVAIELDDEALESRLSEALVEAEGDLESDCEEGHDEHQPDAVEPTEEELERDERIDEEEAQRADDEERHSDEERELCEVDIIDGLVAAPGETIDIQWPLHTLYTSEVYISVHSGWGAEYYLSTIAPNNGHFAWTLPMDLDPSIDDYTIYVESAEDGERTVECWDYADLEVVPLSVEETPTPDPADLIGLVQEMAAQERCPVQGVLVGHFRSGEGEGMSNTFFHGKGFDQDGLAGMLRGRCTSAVDGGGFCRGVYASVSGNTGRLRTQYASLGANEMGAVGTFQGGWQADPEVEAERKNGHLAGVWQKSAEHQKGMFLGFWSACSE